MGGDSLEEFLVKATGDKALRKLMGSMGEAGRQIAFKVRTASCNKTACVNSFGDEQLAVDMLTAYSEYLQGVAQLPVADVLAIEGLDYSAFVDGYTQMIEAWTPAMAGATFSG